MSDNDDTNNEFEYTPPQPLTTVQKILNSTVIGSVPVPYFNKNNKHREMSVTVGNDHYDEEDLIQKVVDRIQKQNIEDTNFGRTRRLNEDTYSFILFSKPNTFSFWCGIVTAILQTAIFGVTLWSLLDVGSSTNVFMIPVNVGSKVNLTQILALAINILLHDNLLDSIRIMAEGYSQDITDIVPTATRKVFYLTYLSQFVSGFLGFAVSILIIAQSSEALDLFESFAAFTFISLTDNVLFSLMSNGLFSDKIADLCEEVQNTELPQKKGKHPHLLRVLVIATLLLIEVIFWSMTKYSAAKGNFFCHTLRVVVEHIPHEPACVFLSGQYLLKRKPGSTQMVTENNRPIYENSNGAKLSYFKDSKEWKIFTDHEITEPLCQLISEKNVFDPLDIEGSQWTLVGSLQIQMSPDYLSISCEDCDLALGAASCNNNGRCNGKSRKCECDENYFGNQCKVKNPKTECPLLKYKNINEKSVSYYKLLYTDGTSFVENEINKNKRIFWHNHRPVYTHFGANQNTTNPWIIIFVGRRWLQFSVQEKLFEMKNLYESTTMPWNVLKENFVWREGFDPKHNFFEISDPVPVLSSTAFLPNIKFYETSGSHKKYNLTLEHLVPDYGKTYSKTTTCENNYISDGYDDEYDAPYFFKKQRKKYNEDGKYINIAWQRLPTKAKDAASTLKITKRLWHQDFDFNKYINPTNLKWEDMPLNERNAAMILFGETTDDDSINDDYDDNFDQNSDKPYDALSWGQLPNEAKAAAETLGYTKDMWNMELDSPVFDLEWYEWSQNQKDAAKLLKFATDDGLLDDYLKSNFADLIYNKNVEWEPKCTKTYNCEERTSFCWDGRCRDTTYSSVCLEYEGQATDDGWKWERDDLFQDLFFECEGGGADALADASADAPVDAPADAPVDAPADAPVNAPSMQ